MRRTVDPSRLCAVAAAAFGSIALIRVYRVLRDSRPDRLPVRVRWRSLDGSRLHRSSVFRRDPTGTHLLVTGWQGPEWISVTQVEPDPRRPRS